MLFSSLLSSHRVRLLILLSFTQASQYFDRGFIAGIVPILQRRLNVPLTDAAAGALGSAFVFGYTLSCPLFAFAATRYSPFKLIAIGLSLWVAAVLGCGLTDSYSLFFFFRLLSGVGEASFAGLAPTLIDDISPIRHRTLWLSIFFGGMPIGGALGYVASGLLMRFGWQAGFFLEAAVGVPIILAILQAEHGQHHRNLEIQHDLQSNQARSHENESRAMHEDVDDSCAVDASSDHSSAHSPLLPAAHSPPLAPDELSFFSGVRLVLCSSIYWLIVFGYSALSFVSGALSFWAPADFSKTLHLTLEESTVAVGLITFFCGILGTGFGGWALDRRSKRKNRGLRAVSSAMELCVLFTSISILASSVAVYLTQPALSLAFLAVGEFFMFGVGAPVNAAILSSAPRQLRSLAMSLSILLMHLFGDLPSPFLMGYLTDHIPNVQFALVSLIAWLSFAIIGWGSAALIARNRIAKQKKQLKQANRYLI